ncbi:hypothetical protein ACFMOM_03070 [Schaalia turicensis]
MISRDLHSLGFDFPEWEDLVRAVIDTHFPTIIREGSFAAVGLYQDTEGAGVLVTRYYDGATYTFPALRGTPGHDVAAVLVDDTTALFELYSPDYPDIPARTLIAYVDDPFMYDKWENGEDEEYTGYEDSRLSAVAKKMAVYSSWEEWNGGREVNDNGVMRPVAKDDPLVGEQLILSVSLAIHGEELEAGEVDNLTPDIILRGTVRTAELVTNALTGQKWWRCEVDCGFLITLALPEDIDPAPAPGKLVDGQAILLGSTGFWEDKEPGIYQRRG